jgi:hypothetical protein
MEFSGDRWGLTGEDKRREGLEKKLEGIINW